VLPGVSNYTESQLFNNASADPRPGQTVVSLHVFAYHFLVHYTVLSRVITYFNIPQSMSGIPELPLLSFYC
jgi:hypothetical protein